MARQVIDLGTSPNRGDGDPLRTAFDKINDNFAELYAGNFAEPDATASDLVPNADATYNLGSADNQWADLYVKDFIYLNGTRLEVDANKNLRLDGITIAADSQGSVFGDDSTLLVDGVNNVINLNGTISTHIIPTTTETYDLGSASNRFRDLYLSGSTIDLGGTTLSISGGSLQVGGTSVITQSQLLDGSLEGALSGFFNGDVTGSVFADDSTLLVDGVSGTIPGTLTGNWTSPGNFFSVSGGGFTVNSTTNTALSISDFGISFSNSVDDNAIAFSAYNGSFGLSGDGSFSVAMDTLGISIGSIASIVVGSDLGISIGGDVNLAATNININGTTNGTFNGDITGSVFADDSTLLVDGVSGTIPAENLSGTATIDIVTTSITNLNDIEITSGDDVSIITDSTDSAHEWFFASGGYLDFPTDGYLHFNGDAGILFFTDYDPVAGYTANIDILDTGSTAELRIQNDATNGEIDIRSNGPTTILTDQDGTGYQWSFGADGGLDTPGTITAAGTITVTADGNGTLTSSSGYAQLSGDNGAELWFDNEAGITSYIGVEEDSAAIILTDTTPGSGSQSSLAMSSAGNATLASAAWINLITNNGPSSKTFRFDSDGALTFPDSTVQTTAWNGVGDLTGSVFADDSTLLVDGVNGLITGRVTGPTYDPTNTVLLADPEDGDSYYNVISRDGSTTLVDAVNGNIPLQVVDKFVNRSLFSSDFTVNAGSATFLQFDAYQGSQAFSEVTYQWSPANTGLYRLDFVLGLTQSEADLPLIVFLYNVTANANQIQLYNGTFSGSVLSMSGTTYLTAGQNYQFGIIQNVVGDAIILDKDLTSVGIEELTRA